MKERPENLTVVLHERSVYISIGMEKFFCVLKQLRYESIQISIEAACSLLSEVLTVLSHDTGKSIDVEGFVK